MIRITVELIPHGDESIMTQRRVLGTLEIANDGTGTLHEGNYNGILHAEYTDPAGRKGKVLKFNRRKQSVWSLIGAFLKLWGHTSHSPKLLIKE